MTTFTNLSALLAMAVVWDTTASASLSLAAGLAVFAAVGLTVLYRRI